MLPFAPILFSHSLPHKTEFVNTLFENFLKNYQISSFSTFYALFFCAIFMQTSFITQKNGDFSPLMFTKIVTKCEEKCKLYSPVFFIALENVRKESPIKNAPNALRSTAEGKATASIDPSAESASAGKTIHKTPSVFKSPFF